MCCAYDPNGAFAATWGSYARLGLSEALSSTEYNADNELVKREAQTLKYDKDGNLTEDGANEYSWNARNQLIPPALPGAEGILYWYANGDPMDVVDPSRRDGPEIGPYSIGNPFAPAQEAGNEIGSWISEGDAVASELGSPAAS